MLLRFRSKGSGAVECRTIRMSSSRMPLRKGSYQKGMSVCLSGDPHMDDCSVFVCQDGHVRHADLHRRGARGRHLAAGPSQSPLARLMTWCGIQPLALVLDGRFRVLARKLAVTIVDSPPSLPAFLIRCWPVVPSSSSSTGSTTRPCGCTSWAASSSRCVSFVCSTKSSAVRGELCLGKLHCEDP
jgi:hypothetical protein